MRDVRLSGPGRRDERHQGRETSGTRDVRDDETGS